MMPELSAGVMHRIAPLLVMDELRNHYGEPST